MSLAVLKPPLIFQTFVNTVVICDAKKKAFWHHKLSLFSHAKAQEGLNKIKGYREPQSCFVFDDGLAAFEAP